MDSSKGYAFLVGKSPKKDKNNKIKLIGNSPYKRWNMYLRWMVRSDEIDPGGWTSLRPNQLIVPLDVHLHRVAIQFGLTQRKSADLKAAVEVTESLRRADPLDPLRFDFALTRPGILGIAP